MFFKTFSDKSYLTYKLFSMNGNKGVKKKNEFI